MKRAPLTASVILLLLGSTALRAADKVPASGLPTAKPESVGLSSEKLARVTKTVQKLVDDRKIAGAVTIIARKGKVVYFQAVGYRDLAAKTPMTKDTIFRFYSMTKPVTSVAVMMLVDQGKLSLDDPVSKHLPEFKGLRVYVKAGKETPVTAPQKREMTVRDLLRHTSGLAYGKYGNSEIDKLYREAGVFSSSDDLTTMVRKLGKIPLLYQPGTKWNYSASVDVLGRLVEVKSGQRLDRFFQEHILQPLGMKDTAFYVPDSKLKRFATNYSPDDKGGLKAIDNPVNSRYRKPPVFYSGGSGLVSTAADYIRFCQMLLNGGTLDGKRILKAETVKLMTKNQLPKSAYPINFGGFKRQGVGFGLGFSVITERMFLAPFVPVGEYGWSGVACTHFFISPKDDLAVITLSQHMPFTIRLEYSIKPLIYNARIK